MSLNLKRVTLKELVAELTKSVEILSILLPKTITQLENIIYEMKKEIKILNISICIVIISLLIYMTFAIINMKW